MWQEEKEVDEEKLSHILFQGEHLTECLWLGHLAQEMATLIVADRVNRVRVQLQRRKLAQTLLTDEHESNSTG